MDDERNKGKDQDGGKIEPQSRFEGLIDPDPEDSANDPKLPTAADLERISQVRTKAEGGDKKVADAEPPADDPSRSAKPADDPSREKEAGIDEDLLAMATRSFGLTAEEAKLFGTTEKLRDVLGRMALARIGDEPAGPESPGDDDGKSKREEPKDDAEVEGKSKSEGSEAEEPLECKLSREAYADDLVEQFEAVVRRVNTLATRLERAESGTKATQQKSLSRWFETRVAGLDDSWRETVGEGKSLKLDRKSDAFKNRSAILDQMDKLEKVALLRGELPGDDDDLFDEALRMLWPDHGTTTKVKVKEGKRGARAAAAIPNSTASPSPHPEQPSERAAIDHIKNRLDALRAEGAFDDDEDEMFDNEE